jgi:putative oxidoreductase
MKIVTIIARVLLGVVFLFFGLNGLLNFLPQPPLPPGPAGQFLGVLFVSHYVIAVSLVQVVSGALFLINRYVPLALILIGPVIVNILLFHILMAPSGILPGALATVCWIIVAWNVRSAFAGIFQSSPSR